MRIAPLARLLTATALLAQSPQPSEDEIRIAACRYHYER